VAFKPGAISQDHDGGVDDYTAEVKEGKGRRRSYSNSHCEECAAGRKQANLRPRGEIASLRSTMTARNQS